MKKSLEERAEKLAAALGDEERDTPYVLDVLLSVASEVRAQAFEEAKAACEREAVDESPDPHGPELSTYNSAVEACAAAVAALASREPKSPGSGREAQDGA